MDSPSAPPSDPPDPRLGSLLQGRYRILARVASGAMGVVYRGERVQLGRPVAIKFLHPWIAAQQAFRGRFENEARAMSRLAHPHCVSVIDFGVDGGPYLVMDFVTGRTLREVMDGSPLPTDRALRILRQLLSGLAHAHAQGIIHRDLKPENLILGDETGLEDHLRILDFGLAKLRDGPAMTAGLAVGTPSYMSPEQTGVEGTVDARTDLYAVGVLMFELLSGRKPFHSDKVGDLILMHREAPVPSLRAVVPGSGFSAEIEAVVTRAMAKRQDDRFQTAADFVAAIDATPEATLGGRAPVEKGGAAPAAPVSLPPVSRPAPAPSDATIVDSPSRIQRLMGSEAAASATPAVTPRRALALGRRQVLALGGGLAAALVVVLVVALARGGGEASGPTTSAVAAPGGPAAAVAHPPAPQGPEDPRMEEARQLLVRGDWEQAVGVLNRLRAEDPENADAPYMLANIYLDNKRWPDGVAAAQVAIHKNPALKADPDLIKAVIRSLVSDRSYEKSEAVLRNMGAAAIPFIKEAAHHDESPKVRERATELLDGGGRGRGWGSSARSERSSGGSMFHR